MSSTTYEFTVRLQVEDATAQSTAEIDTLLAGEVEVEYDGQWLGIGGLLAMTLLSALSAPVKDMIVEVAYQRSEAPEAPTALESALPSLGAPSGGGAGGVKSSQSSGRTLVTSTASVSKATTRKTKTLPRRPKR